MNAGLPGTGIGGVFYLLSALLMPFHELYKTVKNKKQPQRTRLIFAQSGMALGIVAGIWVTGWALGELLAMVNAWQALKHGVVTTPTSTLPNIIKVTMIFLTIGLLVMVVGGVHILKLVLRYRQPRQLPALDSQRISNAAFKAPLTPGEISSIHSRDARVEKAEVIG